MFRALHEYSIKSCLCLRRGIHAYTPRRFAVEAITTIKRCEKRLVPGRASFVLKTIHGDVVIETTTWVNLTPPIVLDAACHPDRVGRVKDRFSVEAVEQASARERSFACSG